MLGQDGRGLRGAGEDSQGLLERRLSVHLRVVDKTLPPKTTGRM